MDTCQNCGRGIGNLETPRVYGDSVVCAECEARLKPQLAVAPVTNQTVNFNKIDVHAPLNEEVVFYTDANLLVSNRRIVADVTYNTRAITSVRVIELPNPRMGYVALLILLSLLSAAFAWGARIHPDVSVWFRLFGAIAGAGSAVFLIAALVAKRRFAVALTTNAQETPLITSPYAQHLRPIHAAITQAIASQH